MAKSTMAKSEKYEFFFKEYLSVVISKELQSLDHFRSDEKYFRTDLRVERYRNIQRWLEERIQKLEDAEELLEQECATLGTEYK